MSLKLGTVMDLLDWLQINASPHRTSARRLNALAKIVEDEDVIIRVRSLRT